MDLQEVWKKLETEKLEKPVKGANRLNKKSKHPIQKLKDAYLTTTGLTVVFLIGFVFLFFQFDSWLIQAAFAGVIFGYIFFLAINFSMYKKINTVLPMDQSLKEILHQTHLFISDNIHFQERVALFIYPVAATAGFLVGASGEVENIESFMTRKIVILLLFVTLTILTPTCFYLTRWLYKVSYGKCLEELKDRIDELEKPD